MSVSATESYRLHAYRHSRHDIAYVRREICALRSMRLGSTGGIFLRLDVSGRLALRHVDFDVTWPSTVSWTAKHSVQLLRNPSALTRAPARPYWAIACDSCHMHLTTATCQVTRIVVVPRCLNGGKCVEPQTNGHCCRALFLPECHEGHEACARISHTNRSILWMPSLVEVFIEFPNSITKIIANVYARGYMHMELDCVRHRPSS